MTELDFDFPRAFVTAFGIAHILSTVVGIWSPVVGMAWSIIGMTLLGLLTLLATLPHKSVNPVRMGLAVFYVWAFLFEWLHGPAWVPPWTDLQYVVMALINLTCAVCLLMMSDEEVVGP